MVQNSNPEGTARLPRRILVGSWLRWLFFSHATYNYERLQGLGFAHAMVPVIRALYTAPQDVAAALKRHLVFFNSEPQVGAMVPGIVIAMEEERAAGADVSDEAINAIKSGLMGPLSGLGDTITQGLITPVLLALGISLASEGSLAGPILYFLLMAATIIPMSYVFWMQGYRWGRAAVQRLLSGGAMQRMSEAAGVLGMSVLGALVAGQVSLSLAANVVVGEQTVSLQSDVLDGILIGLLPLLLTLGIWQLLRVGSSPLTIIGMVFVGGIDGVLLEWLGWAPTTVTWHSLGALALSGAAWWALLGRRAPTWLRALLLAALWGWMLWWGRWSVTMVAGMALLAWQMVRASRRVSSESK
jgi:mannose PTS system EIID component